MKASELFDLSGKVALVTGGSRGIGASIAHCLADNGAQVIVSSRNIEGCEEVAAAIRAHGGQAEAVACHIGDMANIEALFARLAERPGRLDILVNNGAANPYFGHICDTDIGAFEKTVDVNIRGYFYMSARAARLMEKNGGGSIVNVASVNGVTPGAQRGIYSITKAAVISMTKAFAAECAPMGVRVNALLPGATDTKFAAALFRDPTNLEKALRRIPQKRVAEPDEMAGAVLYFASGAAGFTTGACVNVDGGFLAA